LSFNDCLQLRCYDFLVRSMHGRRRLVCQNFATWANDC
jgi:hypothetical protein